MRPYQLKIAFVLGLICLFAVSINAVQTDYEKNPIALIKRFNNPDMTLKIIYDLAVEKKTIGSESLELDGKEKNIIKLWNEPDFEPWVGGGITDFTYIEKHKVQISIYCMDITTIIDHNIGFLQKITKEDVVRNWGEKSTPIEMMPLFVNDKTEEYTVLSKDKKKVTIRLHFVQDELKAYQIY